MTRICCPFDQSSSVIGGVVCGGSAFVDVVSDPYDGLTCILPLDEIGGGTVGEYKDRSRNHLDGTGGKILAEEEDLDTSLVPTIDAGVFCLPSQHFDGRQSIWIEQDDMDANHSFTASIWGKFETYYKTRTFYSRGFTDGTNRFVVALGHSFLQTLAVQVNVAAMNGTITENLSFGSTALNQDSWYHAAMTYDQSNIRLYLNGVLVGTLAISGTLLPLENECFLGCLNGAQNLQGNLQELHVFPETKSANYLLAEYNSICNPNFVIEGDEEPLLYW